MRGSGAGFWRGSGELARPWRTDLRRDLIAGTLPFHIHLKGLAIHAHVDGRGIRVINFDVVGLPVYSDPVATHIDLLVLAARLAR